MILCLETNKRANTDYIYMKETIDYLYQKSNQVKISIVYMKTKSKYCASSVLKEISRKTKDYVQGETKVIYCIDTDEYEKDTKHAKELNDIQQFCKRNDYDLIWFCHDVEEVFWGKKIPDSAKVQKAEAFRRKRKIEEMSVKELSDDTIKACRSNILNVLDKYLIRK